MRLFVMSELSCNMWSKGIVQPLPSNPKCHIASTAWRGSTSSVVARQSRKPYKRIPQLQPPSVQLVAYMLRENRHTTNLHQLHSLTVHATVWAQYLSLAFTSSGSSPTKANCCWSAMSSRSSLIEEINHKGNRISGWNEQKIKQITITCFVLLA
jgi:hypothetical protein